MTSGAVSGLDEFGFDQERLRQFLTEHVSGLAGPMTLERVSGGQSNPTFFLTFDSRRLVLRKKPAGPLLPRAHAIDREFRVLTALTGTAVPVPRPVLFHGDDDVIGTPFYLMERLEGRVFHDCALPTLGPDERRSIYLSMADTLAELHRLDPAALSLGDFGPPGNYFERQIARWSRQWAASPSAGIPALDLLAGWLAAHLPVDDGRLAVAHGDYRLGNLVIHPTEARVIGVLDWELSTLGHPLADLGFCCMAWHTRPHEYRGIQGLDIAALGIPTQAEFVERYEAGAMPAGPLRRFHLAFSLFRFAVIFVGIADRARAGNAASSEAGELGQLAENFATRALDLAEGRVPF